MSLFDKTDPRAFAIQDRRRARAGQPRDTRPRCEFCNQIAGWCLCGGPTNFNGRNSNA